MIVRRLLRVQRWLHALQEQLGKGQIDENLLNAYHRGINNLEEPAPHDLDATMSWEDADRLISETLQQILNVHTKERTRKWHEEQNIGYMEKVFEHIGGKTVGHHTTVTDASGKLTSKPDRIVAEAVKQWSKKQHDKLEENLAREHGTFPYYRSVSI